MRATPTNSIHMPTGVTFALTIGLLIPTQAVAEPQAGWTCTGQPIQIGQGIDPEKDTVGFICLGKDVDVTGSTAIHARNGKWIIAPVGRTTGNAEHDSVGYVQE